MPTEILTKPDIVQPIDMAISPEARQARLFRRFEQGGVLEIPNFLDTDAGKLNLQSYELESPLGNEAHLVSLHEDGGVFQEFFKKAGKSEKARDRLANMTLEATVRLLDTSGADGLHHIHDTVFPGTVYYSAKNGKGEQRNVYLTNLGETEHGVPVIAFITATGSKKDEYKLFRAIGAGNQKGRRNP